MVLSSSLQSGDKSINAEQLSPLDVRQVIRPEHIHVLDEPLTFNFKGEERTTRAVFKLDLGGEEPHIIPITPVETSDKPVWVGWINLNPENQALYDDAIPVFAEMISAYGEVAGNQKIEATVAPASGKSTDFLQTASESANPNMIAVTLVGGLKKSDVAGAIGVVEYSTAEHPLKFAGIYEGDADSLEMIYTRDGKIARIDDVISTGGTVVEGIGGVLAHDEVLSISPDDVESNMPIFVFAAELLDFELKNYSDDDVMNLVFGDTYAAFVVPAMETPEITLTDGEVVDLRELAPFPPVA